MGEWRECKLGDVLGEKGYIRGPFGSSLRRGEMKESGIPVYEQKNAIYNDRTFRFFIDNRKFQELSRFQVETNDLIISCSGTVGKISIIRDEDPKGIISQALLILRPEIKKIELKFLYFLLSSRQGFSLLTQASHGSVQINIAERKVVENIPILLPPLPEQRAIVSVLSSLDDKIDLLNRQNQTLEAMAETLFRQWFVEEAEEGTTILREFADNIRINAKVENLKDYNHYVGLEHIPRKNIALSNWGNTDSLESNKSIFEKNDILFGKLRSYFHKVVFAPIQGVCSTDILVIRPKKPEWFSFCLFWFYNENVVEHSDLGSGGTRMPRTNWEIVSGFQIPKPDYNIICEFDKKARLMIKKISSNLFQIRILEKLRGTLLPKLISGEVKIKL